MNSDAVEKAEDHLRRAAASLHELQFEARTDASMKDAWYNFIQAANAVFAKLEQGAKGNPQSVQWFAKQQTIRRQDALLQYLRQARHAEEHSVAGSFSPHGIYVTSGNPWTKIKSSGLHGAPIEVEVQAGKPMSSILNAPGIHLIPVTNRGVTYQVPVCHLGQAISPSSIEVAISMALTFLERMVQEAKKLIPVQSL